MLVADGIEEVLHSIGRVRTAHEDLWLIILDLAAVGSIDSYEGLDVKFDCVHWGGSIANVSFNTEQG